MNNPRRKIQFENPAWKFILAAIFLPVFLKAQNAELNLHKYWYLRWRLVNYFMVVGEGPGKSLPAGIRHRHFSYKKLIDGNYVYTHSNNLDFGDAPNYLGKYLGVLATEYHLLQSENLPFEETLLELYHAINALNRLDNFEGNWPWGNGLKGKLDGCLSRGDVPRDFVGDHSAELNQNLEQFSGEYGDPHSQPVLFGTSYEYGQNENLLRETSVLSQDHISSLFVGLALIKKFVPDNVTVNGLSITKEAKEITHRLISYMIRCDFILRYPDGNRIKGKDGGIAIGLSYGFASAATYINPENKLKYLSQLRNDYLKAWIAASANYYPVSSFCQSALVWESCTDESTWIALNLACVSASWDERSILSHSRAFQWESYYPLLYAVLHDKELLPLSTVVETVLNTMPCHGNYFGKLSPPSPGWATSLRFNSTPEENYYGDTDKDGFYPFEGIYNGLEYMLAFNLYKIHNSNYISYSRTSSKNLSLIYDCYKTDAFSLLSVNPNPNNGRFTVTIQNGKKEQILTITVLDLFGKRIIQKEIGIISDQRLHYDLLLGDVPAGIYFVHLTGLSTRQTATTIVIQD